MHLLTPSKGACSCQSGAHGWCSHCLLFLWLHATVRWPLNQTATSVVSPKRASSCVPRDVPRARSHAVRGSRCALVCGPLLSPVVLIDGSSEPSAAAPPPASACLWSTRASDTIRGCPQPCIRGCALFGGFTIVHTLKTPKRLPSLAGLGSCFLICCSPHTALLNHASRARSVPLSVGSPSAVLKPL